MQVNSRDVKYTFKTFLQMTFVKFELILSDIFKKDGVCDIPAVRSWLTVAWDGCPHLEATELEGKSIVQP